MRQRIVPQGAPLPDEVLASWLISMSPFAFQEEAGELAALAANPRQLRQPGAKTPCSTHALVAKGVLLRGSEGTLPPAVWQSFIASLPAGGWEKPAHSLPGAQTPRQLLEEAVEHGPARAVLSLLDASCSRSALEEVTAPSCSATSRPRQRM